MDQDLGCLQHVDERLSIYGWETGTGARFAIIVDTWGKDGRSYDPGREVSQKALKDGDVKSVSTSTRYKRRPIVADLDISICSPRRSNSALTGLP